MTSPQVPHLHIVVAASAFVLAGFAAVSAYVIGWTSDDVTKGNIIGAWQNFAVLVVGFWIGSSSGGKAKDVPPDSPLEVDVVNPPERPANVQETP
jgi:hypothetical protein